MAKLLLSRLTAPWRVTAGLLTGLASILAGRQPRRGPAVLVVAGLPVDWNVRLVAEAR